MDALSDVLRVVRLTGGVFLDARFTAPWSVAGRVEPFKLEPFLPTPEQVICFHYVVSGRLVAAMDGAAPTEMKPGDIILFPRNDAHVLASALNLTPEPAGDIVFQPPGTGIFNVAHGGGGDETHIVCGFLGSDGGANPLLQALPKMLTLNVADTPAGNWIAESFAFAAQQLARQEAGEGAIIGKLSELMFVEAVRRYIDELPPQEAGWLAGLRDPHIGRALALMHTKPAHDWTAEELANAVNMSRSAFADRFTQLIGTPPMKYLTNWRMQVAAVKLRERRQTIAQIAFGVGYESEAAFTRAFRREMGQPPAAWRKQIEAPQH
ncbi:AraC family transcriptional regulator [Terricaulis silvestris]|uniref:Exoenzyme S synthesis regulatory protein ExsA n=1 Tax=Terricaulis silvestris TaxID=2686094 RepID=A0A6I6MQY8_9CAUL|nr:AraC family transcriptional regulator [Terricaulis silvestris]QGZ95848.1 Exoenzyme S synthesis regulatory protein ExsA [Terricaulis silvestris]